MSYVRYALFPNMTEARGALADIETADQPRKDPITLTVHEHKASDEDPQSDEGDGRRGFLIGLASGGIAGLVLSLFLALLGVLPVPIPQAMAFGLFGGLAIGAIGGGLYGIGLPAEPILRLERLWQKGNVLITAKAEDAQRILQIENIFRRHHAVVEAG
jgi:hypothetical protein